MSKACGLTHGLAGVLAPAHSPCQEARPNAPVWRSGREDSKFRLPRMPGSAPVIHPTAYVHPAAVVTGDVTLGARVSVWPTAVIRGDTASIVIGEDSNVQDGTVVHVDHGVPTTIGARVAIGHRAIVHGATVDDDSLIAMGAILLNGVHVGSGSIVGAGALCPEGMQVPPNSLVLGVPGRIVRETTARERERIRKTVESYLGLQHEYRESKEGSAEEEHDGRFAGRIDEAGDSQSAR